MKGCSSMTCCGPGDHPDRHAANTLMRAICLSCLNGRTTAKRNEMTVEDDSSAIGIFYEKTNTYVEQSCASKCDSSQNDTYAQNSAGYFGNDDDFIFDKISRRRLIFPRKYAQADFARYWAQLLLTSMSPRTLTAFLTLSRLRQALSHFGKVREHLWIPYLQAPQGEGQVGISPLLTCKPIRLRQNSIENASYTLNLVSVESIH